MKFPNDTNNLLDLFIIPSGSAIWAKEDSGYQIAIHYFPLFSAIPDEPYYNVNIHFFLTYQQREKLETLGQQDCFQFYCNETNTNVYITYVRPQQVSLLF